MSKTFVVVNGKHVGLGPTGKRQVFRKGEKVTSDRPLDEIFRGKFAEAESDEDTRHEDPEQTSENKETPKKPEQKKAPQGK